MYIKPDTFGKSKVCVVLADMINSEEFTDHQKHKILSFIGHFINIFKQLSKVKDRATKQYVLNVVKSDFVNKAKMMPYDKKFCTHLQNVIVLYYRKYLNEQ